MKAGSLIMFCTRHTWFVDYRAQKCFVLLPSLTQAECKSPEPVAEPREEAAYLTGELYGSLSGNGWICIQAAFAQCKWRFLSLVKSRSTPLSAPQISVVLFLVLNSMHPLLCLSPSMPMLSQSLEMDKDHLHPPAKKANSLCMTPVISKINKTTSTCAQGNIT